MGAIKDQYWQSDDVDHVARHERRSGPYRAYLPDLLVPRPLAASAELSAKAAEAERVVRVACQGANATALEGISRFLLRSEAFAGVSAWLITFFDAVLVAAEQATRLAGEVESLRVEWLDRVAAHRATRGIRPTPRAGSAIVRILDILTESPVMTTATAKRLLGISFPPARAALEELADSRVVRRKSVDRGSTGYVAQDVLDLIGYAERRLASTQFDTRVSASNRPVAATPRVDN